MGSVLVTGARGKVGRHVVDGLVERGEGVRRASRRPDGEGAVAFDWSEEATWAPALRGVDRLFLVAQDEAAFDPSGSVISFLALAEASGVERVVLLSAMGMEHAPDQVPLRRVELAVQACGMDESVLRPNWFDQNFDAGVFVPAMASGTVPAPTGGAKVSFVDTRDIAAVAVAALTGDGRAGAAHTLTGPQALTFGEAASVLGEAWGRDLAHDDLEPPAMQQYLEGAGLPGEYAEMLTGMMVSMRQGSAETVTHDVESVTGTPARSLADYARTTAAPWG